MLDNKLTACKEAQRALARLDINKRNECLLLIANNLDKNRAIIIEENKKDIDNAKKNGLSSAMIERLTLNDKRIDDLINGINSLIKLDDVVGNVIEEIKRPNGLIIKKELVPFGVIAVIFESRPNVCVDIAALCLKTANACVLKGGKEAIYTNTCLAKIMQAAINDIVDPNVICFIDTTDKEITNQLITKREYIDVLIPRGGKGLINYVVSNAKIPYIETGSGNCHLYVHEAADLNKAIKIAINAKHQRPSVCNAIENILVDEKIANEFLPILAKEFNSLNIEMRGCKSTAEIINCNLATDEDFYTEYNDYIVSIKIVKNLDEAIKHINEHSSKHSEAIISEDIKAYEKFLNEIDSACVYHNASTRFTDGGEFGFGAEIGISTQKLHARGPMGLKEMCSYKYKIYGDGQVR